MTKKIRTPPLKTNSGFAFPYLVGNTIASIEVLAFEAWLHFEGADHIVRAAGQFRLISPDGIEYCGNLDVDPLEASPLLRLLKHKIGSATATTKGILTLVTVSGYTLEVFPHQSFEGWQIEGEQLVICGEGGKVHWVSGN